MSRVLGRSDARFHEGLSFEVSSEVYTPRPFSELRVFSLAKINKVYSQPVFRSGSYYIASSGGVTIERLKKYIDRQQTPR